MAALSHILAHQKVLIQDKLFQAEDYLPYLINTRGPSNLKFPPQLRHAMYRNIVQKQKFIFSSP